MKTSDKGLKLIEQVEGIRLKTYLDTGGVPTIGVGHTGPEVKLGMTITEEQSEEFLKGDVLEAESAVLAYARVSLSQNQFDALVSFVFNVGTNAFKKSTMLRKLNANDYSGAAKEFDRWVYDNGELVAGLVKRRYLEKQMFLGTMLV